MLQARMGSDVRHFPKPAPLFSQALRPRCVTGGVAAPVAGTCCGEPTASKGVKVQCRGLRSEPQKGTERKVEIPMFKKIHLATIAVVGLAGAAHAQTTLIDAVCAHPDLIPTQQIMCSTPRLRANGQRNLTALLQLASKLNPPDQAELVRRVQARGREHAISCRVDPDRPAQLPISKATEVCLAGWQDWTYAETQRGLAWINQQQAGQSAAAK
jgi:hypothetical protein